MQALLRAKGYLGFAIKVTRAPARIRPAFTEKPYMPPCVDKNSFMGMFMGARFLARYMSAQRLLAGINIFPPLKVLVRYT